MDALELTARRLALGYTGLQLARQLGVSQPTVWGWENRRVAIPAGIAAQLDVLEQTQDALIKEQTGKIIFEEGLVLHIGDLDGAESDRALLAAGLAVRDLRRKGSPVRIEK